MKRLRGLTPKETSQPTRSREDKAWSLPLYQQPGCQQAGMSSKTCRPGLKSKLLAAKHQLHSFNINERQNDTCSPVVFNFYH
ncbi:unnamed protein product [Prunus armeniaca]